MRRPYLFLLVQKDGTEHIVRFVIDWPPDDDTTIPFLGRTYRVTRERTRGGYLVCTEAP